MLDRDAERELQVFQVGVAENFAQARIEAGSLLVDLEELVKQVGPGHEELVLELLERPLEVVEVRLHRVYRRDEAADFRGVDARDRNLPADERADHALVHVASSHARPEDEGDGLQLDRRRAVRFGRTARAGRRRRGRRTAGRYIGTVDLGRARDRRVGGGPPG